MMLNLPNGLFQTNNRRSSFLERSHDPCQDIYICPPSVLPLKVRPPRDTQRHEMPGVEGGFVLSDVLSAEECSELRMATEQIGTSAWAMAGGPRNNLW